MDDLAEAAEVTRGVEGGPCHVLVVEDSAAQRLLATQRLKAIGYRVTAVEDGEQALSRIAAGDIDIVLSDWMMPRLDGIGLCRKVRSFSDSAYLYFVLMTARTERESLAEGLRAGADDFIAKPFDTAELAARLGAGRRLADLHHRLDEARQKAEAAHRSVDRLYTQIQQDLSVASSLQRAALPPSSDEVNGCKVAGFCQFSGHVGGDHIGWVPIGEHAVGIYSIDVAGHGIASCLLALRLAALMAVEEDEESLIATLGEGGALIPRPPARVLAALNAMRFGAEEHDLYFTMAYAVLWPESGRVELATAGHWPPVVLGTDGAPRVVEAEGGPPVLLLAETAFPSAELTLAPGERLVLYSDGLPEAEIASSGAELGSEGFLRLLRSAATSATADLPGLLWQRALGQCVDPRDEGHAIRPGYAPLKIDDDASIVIIERAP
ncbi:MAG: SpoIIE family protein phosphatase [Pseudomonadota bacterium]